MRKPGRSLRRSIKEDRSHIEVVADMKDSTADELEERRRLGKIVARLINSPDWEVIENVIMEEAATDSLVGNAMKKEVTTEIREQMATDLVKFGVVTRIINRFHLIVVMGDKADATLRKVEAAEKAEPTQKERKQSERRGSGSPR